MSIKTIRDAIDAAAVAVEAAVDALSSAAEEIGDYTSEKPEAWQESDEGQSFDAMKDRLEGMACGLEEEELPEVECIFTHYINA